MVWGSSFHLGLITSWNASNGSFSVTIANLCWAELVICSNVEKEKNEGHISAMELVLCVAEYVSKLVYHTNLTRSKTK